MAQAGRDTVLGLRSSSPMSGSAATVSTATVRMMPRLAEEESLPAARPAAVPQSTRKSGQLVTVTHGAPAPGSQAATCRTSRAGCPASPPMVVPRSYGRT